MTDPSDECARTITDREYSYRLSRDVADDSRAAGFDTLTSLTMERCVGTAAKGADPEVRSPRPEGSVEGTDAPRVDDTADTGGSLRHTCGCVTGRDPETARTTVLQLRHIGASDPGPGFVGDHSDEVAAEMERRGVVESAVDALRPA
jgi:hypoxanthine phosphoribosyltransferase